MRKKLKIGIVGCGAIGASLAKAIKKDFKKSASLTALFDLDPARPRKLDAKLAVVSLSRLIAKSDLVIEAASAKSSYAIATEALKKGRDVLLMSVGGVITKAGQLSRLAARKNARAYIPSGAISGIDALKAARLSRIKSVTLTTTKHPLSFKGVKFISEKKIKLGQIKKDRVLFHGAAEEAVKHFPQNINVAALLSLAGIGPRRTRVKIVASPQALANTHEIEIVSGAAHIATRTRNVLHPDNPKTSFLAVLSAIATLKGILEPVKIGT
jgi:aspartate dehydrogenase